MTERLMGLALLFEQTARHIYDSKSPKDLHPVQWAALRYFARANRSARTVAGLARYLGVTVGPASRTASSLAKRGLVVSEPNEQDRRSAIFSLTQEGDGELEKDPIARAASAIDHLSPAQLDAFADALDALYQKLAPAD